MKFKVDENLPVEIADLLRSAKHDVTTVHSQRLMGEADRRIIEICKEEDRVLVTLDLDFSNVRAYPPKEFAGIVVLRVHQQDKSYVLAVFRAALTVIGSNPLQHHLWIIEEGRVRVWGEETEL
jgi:predicted nuclease of predicted toxin-antitoxin system